MSSNTTKLGQKLTEARLRSGRNLVSAAKELRIDRLHLQRFESGEFSEAETNALVRGYLKSYVLLLDLDWSEFEQISTVNSTKLKRPQYQRLKSWVLSQKIRSLGIATVILIGLFGISLTVLQLFVAPDLIISTPTQTEIMQTSRQLTVSGQTSPGSDVIINDVPIAVGLRGEFSEKVLLATGVNRVKVVAVNSLSRQAEREFVVVVATSGAQQ